MNRNIRILIVDSDEDMQDFFFRALASQKNFQCFVATDMDQTYKIMNAFPADPILLDINVVRPSYLLTLQKLLSLYPSTVVLITGSVHQMRQLKDAVSMGAHGYLVKPISLYSLRKIVLSHAKNSHLSTEGYNGVSS
jgi:DNA-binding NtrC family response regulator